MNIKSVATLLLVLTIVFFSNCKKFANRPNPVNCIGLVTDTLGTNDTARVFAPTAFSPNGDGRNDLYRILTVGISTIEITVYDENNSVVFSTTQLNPADAWGWRSTAGWSPVTTVNTYAVYYYHIQATTNSNHKVRACGNLYMTNCFPLNADLTLYRYEDQLSRNGFSTSLPTTENANNRCH